MECTKNIMNFNEFKNRPRLKLKITSFDRFLENLGWLLLILLWIKVIFSFNQLPDNIPTHFNFEGEVDGYGSKWTLFILPAAATITYIGLTILNKFPHIFNYIVEITEENAERQYTLSTKMIRTLKFGIVVLFVLISMMTISGAQSEAIPITPIILPAVMSLIIFPLIYYIVKSLKAK